ncbi:MAG: hypothetical protein INQ03_00475 [Candidatus Heimdallarchaeota archaeon]|nr:hypothetical protein [Candidatus Heimdallarchaeota archaeon]
MTTHIAFGNTLEQSIKIISKNFAINRILSLGKSNLKSDFFEIYELPITETYNPYELSADVMNKIRPLIDDIKDTNFILMDLDMVQSIVAMLTIQSLSIRGFMISNENITEITPFELNQLSEDEEVILRYMATHKQSSSVGDLVIGVKWAKELEAGINRKVIARAVYAISKLESRGYVIKNKIGRKVSTEVTPAGINFNMLFLPNLQ